TELVDLSLEAPFEGLVFLATFLPLLYYGRVAAIGVVRPEPGSGALTGFAGIPRVTPVDLTDAAGSARTAWTANRAPLAGLVALLVALLALTMSAGGLGGPAAAAGLPAGPNVPTESFGPAPAPPVAEALQP